MLLWLIYIYKLNKILISTPHKNLISSWGRYLGYFIFYCYILFLDAYEKVMGFYFDIQPIPVDEPLSTLTRRGKASFTIKTGGDKNRNRKEKPTKKSKKIRKKRLEM